MKIFKTLAVLPLIAPGCGQPTTGVLGLGGLVTGSGTYVPATPGQVAPSGLQSPASTTPSSPSSSFSSGYFPYNVPTFNSASFSPYSSFSPSTYSPWNSYSWPAPNQNSYYSAYNYNAFSSYPSTYNWFPSYPSTYNNYNNYNNNLFSPSTYNYNSYNWFAPRAATATAPATTATTSTPAVAPSAVVGMGYGYPVTATNATSPATSTVATTTGAGTSLIIAADGSYRYGPPSSAGPTDVVMTPQAGGSVTTLATAVARPTLPPAVQPGKVANPSSNIPAICFLSTKIWCEGSCGSLHSCGCACDVGCVATGTCCPDFQQSCPLGLGDAASCQGRCSHTKAPAGCRCDQTCATNPQGCCADYKAKCPGPVPTCKNHCGQLHASGCMCDKACTTNGDCCPDYQQMCNTPTPPPTPKVPTKPASCAGLCGTAKHPLSRCSCDAKCVSLGDCCADYTAMCSCQSRCKQAPTAGACSCDTYCLRMGDCCLDYSTVCPTPGPPTPATVVTPPTARAPPVATIDMTYSCNGFCGTTTPGGCRCDHLCTVNGDCCNDYSTRCPNEVAKVPVPGLTNGSCKGICGGKIKNGGCSCDALCKVNKDCCSDYDATCASCAGKCNQPSNGGCACDALCTAHGDCCSDYSSKCAATTTTTTTG